MGIKLCRALSSWLNILKTLYWKTRYIHKMIFLSYEKLRKKDIIIYFINFPCKEGTQNPFLF